MYPNLFTTPGLARVAEEIDAERARQIARWGDQRHPDGTGGPIMRQQADEARAQCQYLADTGGDCYNPDYPEPWPCPTIRALDGAEARP
ncbi:hypothetical protein [Kitasatospora sp. NPDC087314]|uniref:hypothetical protein n=1 Tax=Kitasatospora sp. NPDC087314 TaxID=3364068 RepID=UPI0037FC2F40